MPQNFADLENKEFNSSTGLLDNKDYQHALAFSNVS